MKRAMVLGVLIGVGTLSLTVARLPAAGAAGPEGCRGRQDQGQPLRAEGRRRQHGGLRHRQRRRRRRREEPGLGSADPRQDQGAHAQADHDADQHPHARRSCERQRGIPGDGRRRDAGKHEGEHGEDGHLQAEQRQRDGQADVQGQDDASARAPIRSICTTSDRATRTATRWSSSRRFAPCTPATSSPARVCRSSTAPTAAACCTIPRR